MVERVNFGMEGFDDDEDEQSKKFEAKEAKDEDEQSKKFEAKDAKNDDKDEKQPRVSLDSLFEKRKVEEDDKGPKKLEDLFVSKNPEAEDNDTPEESPEEDDGALEIDHSKNEEIEPDAESVPNEPEETGAEQLDDQPELAGTEAVEATRQLAEQRMDDLQAEQNRAEDPAEEDAILAAADLTENLLGKLDEADEVTDELLDEALAETTAELGFDESEEEPIDEAPEAEPTNIAPETPSFENADETDATATTTPVTTTPPPPPPPPIPPAGSPPATPPSGTVPPSGPAFGPPTPVGIGATPQERIVTVPEKHSHAPYVLAGGVVGYLLGRRRGRIKTEKQLQPVQEKLENEVNDLGAKLKEREDKIRALARQRHTTKPLDQAKLVEDLNQKAERRQEKQAQRPAIEVPPQEYSDRTQPESFASGQSPETIRRAETMTLTELLAVAGKVEFNQVSVKHMFEIGRLDINGLRRIVKEYLQGGNYERELTRSLKVEQQPTSPEAASPESITPIPQEKLEFDKTSHSLTMNQPDIEQIAQERYGLQSSTPQIGNYGGSAQASFGSGSNKNKVAIVVGSTVAVVAFAVVLALLLLAIL